MNRDAIIRMAEEAGLYSDGTPDSWDDEAIIRLSSLVAAAEREACARIAELVAREIDDTNGTATYIAKAIRARGDA